MKRAPRTSKIGVVSTRTVPDSSPARTAAGDGAFRAPAASFDALLPPEMAAKAESIGVTKARLASSDMFVLAVLAGAFIALGAMFATTVTAGTAGAVPYGVARLLAGLVFCLGLILVVVAGAELFTGNHLIVMAWADRRVALSRMLRNWGIVYAGNLVGATSTAALLFLTKQYTFGGGEVGLAALNTAELKSGFGFGQAIALGIMCNALVCLAIWLTYSARSVTDKVLAIVFPITAFVAAGFEHSIANMYFLPIGLFVKEAAPDSFWNTIDKSASDFPDLTLGNVVIGNLLPVTAGNIIGGSLMVGLVYWLVYVRPHR
jgi:formate transporter FocA